MVMTDFTSVPIEEHFTIRGHTYHLNGDPDVGDLVEAMGRIQEWRAARQGDAIPTRAELDEMHAAFAAVFRTALAPEDGQAFVKRLDNKEISLLREAVPALNWVVERLGKLLGTSALTSADGGDSGGATSTDIVLPGA